MDSFEPVRIAFRDVKEQIALTKEKFYSVRAILEAEPVRTAIRDVQEQIALVKEAFYSFRAILEAEQEKTLVGSYDLKTIDDALEAMDHEID